MVAKKETTKSFAGSSKKDVAPIKFEVGDVELEAFPTVDGWTTLQFVKGITGEDPGANMAAVETYLEHSFDDANLKKFIEAIRDPKNGFNMDDVSEIMSWLFQERSGDKDLAESSQS